LQATKSQHGGLFLKAPHKDTFEAHGSTPGIEYDHEKDREALGIEHRFLSSGN
jgi:hypothetical protein